ncbi:GAF domain-containing sensor histidine kinase [Candidatus Oscillochloris fontis]|uniref:GAF domain-containing sensor histidine kinase n=1 Tax=Candidatus Oscillochloris fontis TaxID=2496868 RepID=UPI0015842A17|nr:sensor histidine kinase [Candidatus Oscillochloris fontis]
MLEPRDTIHVLRSLRWPLAAVIGLVFALVRLVETFFIRGAFSLPLRDALDPLFWGGLAGGAIWVVLSWAASQEYRRRTNETAMLSELRRSTIRLEQLYELNQRIASSATLDEVLDYAITLPARLIGATAAALVLYDEQGHPILMRSVGMSREVLQTARASFGLLPTPPDLGSPQLFTNPSRHTAVVTLPLAEGEDAPVGWIEAYLSNLHLPDERIADDRLSAESATLLITVAGELAEAVQGSRRRARSIASVAVLEQAIMAERTRIARDLHDGVAQSLAFMRMRIDLWEEWLEHDPQRLSEEFRNLKANLRRQIEELRRAIFALRPFELSQLGFSGAMRRFVDEFADQQGWDLQLDLTDLPPDLSPALELAAFRFVQEGLNNAAKHAQPHTVTVILHQIDAGLQIIVRDDGLGFNPGENDSRSGTHLGLRQMRERAAALDGRVTVISRPGAGTELRVWLPLWA